jgi:hypothetical protein
VREAIESVASGDAERRRARGLSGSKACDPPSASSRSVPAVTEQQARQIDVGWSVTLRIEPRGRSHLGPSMRVAHGNA